ncbi:HNH endonuclease family protein [Angustibacter aerolatus]
MSTKKLLAALTVSGEHTSGYKRSKFKLWVDTDHDHCNTRAEVLITEATKKPRHAKKTCKLTGGKWTSPYDGAKVTAATKLDIDHMVPLNEAWQSGAFKWDAATRTSYANDLGYKHSLVAVTAHANRSKGDKEPQAWMPAKSTCWYVTSWTVVKWRWHLNINPAEKNYLADKLASCGWPEVTAPKRPHIGHPKKTSAPPSSAYNCPAGYPIKGNASSMIYHVPGGQFYDVTNPEECFSTEAAARAAGYRKSKR